MGRASRILDCLGVTQRGQLLFVHPPHVRIMTALAPHVDKTKFVRWTVKGSELPPRWDERYADLSAVLASNQEELLMGSVGRSCAHRRHNFLLRLSLLVKVMSAAV